MNAAVQTDQANEMLSIRDDKSGNVLRFLFHPAADPANAPILIDFHGWGGSPYNFAHPEWNILEPWDNFGFARQGTWWLGDSRQLFMLDLLDQAIKFVSTEYRTGSDIYTWGSSMGGFGALLHGMRWGAKAVCANVPQVNVLAPTWYGENKRKVDAVFGPELNSRYADVTNFINFFKPEDNPLFFIIQSRHDMHPNYTKEQCFYLTDKFNQAGCNYFLQILPVKGHEMYTPPGSAIRLFSQYAESIETIVSA